jgi:POT family proton-dependent oligopeptide transporter
MPTISQTMTTSDSSGLAGHPQGLTTLFFTEMWERFSYYGMRALLILYMTAPLAQGGLGFDTPKAGHIYGLYTGSVYLTCLLGGWLADKFFGARRAVLIGGIIIACGHFVLAFSSLATFYAGLCLVAGGTGLLKPNVSTIVGSLYGEGDARRDAGFSIFYMGINLGAFIAPFVCGYLGQNIAWHYGFAAAGVGMVLGLFQYVAGAKKLGLAGLKRQPQQKTNMQPREPLTVDEKKRLAAIFILALFSILFFMALEQAGSSLNLFADRLTRHEFMGLNFPSSWLQAANPIFVILFAPVFAWLWIKLGHRQPSSPTKFVLGLIFAGMGFSIVAYASTLASAGPVSPMWLTVAYLFNSFGELCLSPVGLSTVTKLAPARLVGSMMGVWFTATAVGNYLAGRVGGFFQANDQSALLNLFGTVALVTIGAGILLALLVPFIKKLTPRSN